MTFDYFDSVKAPQGKVCTPELFLSAIEDMQIKQRLAQIGAAAAANDTEAVATLKRHLPIVTWQASFRDHKRSNAAAIPSGLFMLDVDHIPDLQKFKEEIVDPLTVNDARLAKELGVMAVHITPSGAGMRFVCLCPQGMTTIEGCQQWLAAQLGIVSFDTACKDFARSSFLVAKEMFLYLDVPDLFHGEPRNILPVPYGEEAATKAAAQPQPQQRTFTEAQKTFKYRDHLISDIAALWVEKHGEPQQGERHTYYYRLCAMFRYITDSDVAVLLAQLPDFGMGIAEREKEAQHACNRSMGTQIPYTFYKFLVDNGIIVASKSQEPLPAIDLAEVFPTSMQRVPSLPVVFREFCKNCPADFVYPTIVALLPVLGTLATRLRARYLDGREHTTSFISVVFAPQSAGKSFARDVVATLTKDLRKHDEISILKEKQYKAELRMKKNSEQLPEDPHAPYRLVQAVISVPRLLQRQEDACGLHQLSFVEEIDTLVKSNAGGSYAQKSDLYRQAFDNAEYGQDYISIDTFTGSVKLFYNILMLGTPKQLYKFFSDAENGLVSRCAFAELQGQEFASIPYFKPLTDKQLEEITKVLNRFEAMTYRRKNAQSEDYIVLPTVNIDAKMQPVRDALAKWLERTRLQALEANDIALDTFRRRAAVKAFRLGMICVGMYAPRSLSPKVMQRIVNFVTWFATQDAEQTVRAFGNMMQASAIEEKPQEKQSLYEVLPDTFNVAELIAWQRKLNKKTTTRDVLYRWRKAGLIKQNDDLTFTKTK
ncbi:MAG: DUF3987 domain-containing protein [Bacteroidaceae bacterium]|nr:DUF3987 domain-containing protein [Bacteroidaceae bacterium]